MTMPGSGSTLTQPMVGKTNPTTEQFTLFATSQAFGQRMKTRGSETDEKRKDSRRQLELQAVANNSDRERVVRAGGWVATDATQSPTKQANPLAKILTPTITATFNATGSFGAALTEPAMEQILRDMTNHIRPGHFLDYTVGRVQARVLTNNVTTDTEDKDALARFVTEATIQAALWCDRIKPQAVDTTLENRVLGHANRVIKTQDAAGTYAELLPGIQVCNIETHGNGFGGTSRN